MEEDNPEKQAPRLTAIRKNNIYRTPEGMWDDFPFSVQQAISSQPVLSASDKMIRSISWGFSSCVFLCMILIGMNSFNGTTSGPENKSAVLNNTSGQNNNEAEKVEYYPFSFYAVSSEPLTKTNP